MFVTFNGRDKPSYYHQILNHLKYPIQFKLPNIHKFELSEQLLFL